MPKGDPQPGDTFRRESDGVLWEIVPVPDGHDAVGAVLWARPKLIEPFVRPLFLRDFKFVSGADAD